ncbi:MAG TPA: type II toxin-antitoxin system RelE/ParE family toxin [Myxococcales bacterium]|jgi:hypothetical protein
MVEVIATDEFADWYQDLKAADADAVTFSVEILREKGIALGSPHSSAVEGAKHALRELRVQSGGRPLRVFYAFDPLRQAVLLLGGDKTGKKRFYEDFVPKAEELFEQYLAEQAAGLHKKDEE